MADFDLEGKDLSTLLALATEQGASLCEPSPLVTVGDQPLIVRQVVPEGWTVKDTDLSTHFPNPQRKTGTVEFCLVESFVSYVNRHKMTGTTIFTEKNQFRAYLNGHEAARDSNEGAAGWHDHVAVYTPEVTDAWKAWRAADGRDMNQQQFAEFLEDRIVEIVEPDGATLYEIATTLKVKNNIDFESKVSLHNGAIGLVYRENIEGVAGDSGQLRIPEQLVVRMAPFEGTELVDLTARFRYRVRDGHLTMAVRLGEEARRVERDVIDRLAEHIHSQTQTEVLYGRRVS